MSQVEIRNGLVLDPVLEEAKPVTMYITGSVIAGIDDRPADFEATQTIDASGLIVSPGIVDLCARLREPGLEHKADINSECIAAASAGITSLCCPPDTDPVIDEPAVVELIHRQAIKSKRTRVVTLGALTCGLNGELLSEMGALKAAGCVGVGNARRPVANTLVLKRALSYAANCGLTVHIEPDDHWLSEGGCAHNGAVSTRLGLQGIPCAAETVAIARALELVSETGVRAHFGRLSTAKSVEMIARAKQNGLQVTADVAAHQLFLTDMDISNFNSQCHVIPPLRSQRDREALRAGLADGVIDAICSDHQPHEPDAKHAPFASTMPGVSALETLLPLTLRLVDEQLMPTWIAQTLITSGPAAVLGLNTGILAPGMPADLCLYDPEAEWQLDPGALLSRGRNTPFAGWHFRGRVRYTLVDGRVIHSS